MEKMTPKEIVRKTMGHSPTLSSVFEQTLIWESLLAVANAAICDEREACARVAEICDISPTEAGYTERERIAAAIRARKGERE